MRIVTIVILILISSLGLITLLFTNHNVESGSRTPEETTSLGIGEPERTERSEFATATITFRSPVSVEEMLRLVGEENRRNITTVESSFEVGGESVWESQPIPRRLQGAAEIKRHLTRNRLGALSDMSAVPGGSPELQEEAGESERAAEDPATREVGISKVTLEGDSLELELLPNEPDENIGNVSVITQSEMFEMIEKMQKEAERRGEAPLEFN